MSTLCNAALIGQPDTDTVGWGVKRRMDQEDVDAAIARRASQQVATYLEPFVSGTLASLGLR
jgi:hypothetical protein